MQHLVALGARTRRHRLFRDVNAFSLPVFIAVIVEAMAYLAVHAGTEPHWRSVFASIGVLALVPVISALVLSAFRRQEAPIVTAAAVVTICFSFAVSFLSALRIPVSFAGFAAALPLAIFVMAAANVRFHRTLSARVALLALRADAQTLKLIADAGVAVIDDPDADVSAFDTVLIDPVQHHTNKWAGLLARCYVARADIVPWTQFIEIRHGRVDVSTFDLAHLAYSPSQMLYARLKRLVDVAAVLATLPVTLPLTALTALYIFVRDRGPVLFIQHRRGFGGKAFRMYKLRTMYEGTAGGATEADDTRIVPGCRLVRRLRLDELPQLYNVLIGDMSLIGPRPVAEYVARASIRVEEKYALRNLVQPGVTGWAQVTSGYAATTDEEIEKLAYDLYYIKHLSFDLDLLILFKTIRTVLFGVGAR